MSELRVNTITEASTGTGITFTNSIVSGNLGTITQRSSSSSSPTFTRSSGTAIDSTVLGNLYGSTSVDLDSTGLTHKWLAWDYGSGNARKITKLQWLADNGEQNSNGIFLEGSNEDSPNASAGHSDWTQLKSFGNIVNDAVYSYSSPVTATTLKYRHYRIRYSWSSNNGGGSIHSFVLEDTDSTFDARTALNATGDAPIYACRAWVNFNGTGTIAIRGSGNVSSIIDNGTGIYTINFTTAMPDANYSVTGIANGDTGGVYPCIDGPAASGADVMSTSQIRIRNKDQNSNNVDSANTCVQVFR